MARKTFLRTAFLVTLFLIGIGAQSARIFTPFGANINFFMAGLPALALAVTPGAYAFTALAAIVLLKTIPAFELSSLVLAFVPALIFFARRLPLHPFILNPVLSVLASAVFYVIVDRTFFAARDLLFAEFLTTAFLSLVLTLFATYATVRR